MSFSIKNINDPSLRKKSANLTRKDLSKNIVDNLFKTLYKIKNHSLSAPELGINKNIFIIDTTNGLDDFFGIKEVFINPKIIEYSTDRDILEEKCLTMPNVSTYIERPNKIKIEYRDVLFNKQTKEFENIEARFIQHNYDHLMGILIVDRMNTKDRKRISKKIY